MRALSAFAAGLTTTAFAAAAFADVGDTDADYIPEPSTRRSEVVLGTHFGAGLGNATGYPNEVQKIDVAEFEADTGFAVGGAGSLWVGAALRDWFTFGLGLSMDSVSGGDLKAGGTAFIVHIEAFPLFYEGGTLEELGVFAEFGAGSRTIEEGSDEVGDGGLMSSVSGGLFWEPLRLGPVSAGPALGVTHEFSQSMKTTLGLVGLRVVFYGGP